MKALTSSLQSADLTTTIVWVRFSYRYPTAAREMQHVDYRLPFFLQQIAGIHGNHYRVPSFPHPKITFEFRSHHNAKY